MYLHMFDNTDINADIIKVSLIQKCSINYMQNYYQNIISGFNSKFEHIFEKNSKLFLNLK